MPKTRNARQTLNDKVAALKRESILDAARGVFASRGYHRTTIKDIAAQAGVADGTVYNYFDNKDALLSALFDRYQHAAPPTPGPAYSQTELVQQSLDPQTLELVRVMLSEMLVDTALRERYRERLLAPINLLIAQPSGAALDDPLASRAIAATALGLVMLHLLGDPVVEAHWDHAAELLITLAGKRTPRPKH